VFSTKVNLCRTNSYYIAVGWSQLVMPLPAHITNLHLPTLFFGILAH
jgi:hypothetical protein